MKRTLARELFRRGVLLCRDFGSDRRGNVMMMFGLFMVPLFLFVGAALDYTRALDARTKMQSVADLATIAATKELLKDGVTAADAEAVAKSIFNSQINSNPEFYGTLSNIKPIVKATKTLVDGVTTTTVEVGATAEIDLMLASAVSDMKLFDLGVRSVSENTAKAVGALSMFLVLDKSGSMSWSGKMDSLKQATDDLLTQLSTADPDKKYVRTGAAGYDTNVSSFKKLDWGVSHTDTYTQALVASGGTNTASGVKIAFNQLKKSKEEKQHDKKNGQVPKKFMLLLTDGSNNKTSWDTDTKKYCNKAKDKGIEIYTVAFQAPVAGEKLLKDCATSIDHYFDASQAAELVAAFKAIGAQVADSIPRVTF